MPIENGSVCLLPGALIQIGNVKLVACDERGAEQDADITSPSLNGYSVVATGIYGSQTKAAKAIGAAQSTILALAASRQVPQRRQELQQSQGDQASPASARPARPVRPARPSKPRKPRQARKPRKK